MCNALPGMNVAWRTATQPVRRETARMDHRDMPIITSHLVFPFERSCSHGTHRYPALVFAERGRIVLFAAEYARRFGVGLLTHDGLVVDAAQYATLDDAARVFLSRS